MVEPPDDWPGGNVLLPMFDVMSVYFRPSTSAAMIAKTVRAPVPMSCVAVFISTEPSGLIVHATWFVGGPPPPHWCSAMPTPRLIGPAPFWPRGFHLSFQPNSSAPWAIWSR